jgi:SWI/SNF-related matrix-associated actin-dependent regulator of chromatin subfamily A containing DEAD/H box 1
VFEGYQAVDEILQECESIGANLRSIISSWSTPSDTPSTRASTPSTTGQFDDGSISLRSLDAANKRKPKDFLLEQPSIIAEGVRLKDYQLLGVNWLRLLHRKKLSCILADEMGIVFGICC